MANWRLHAFSRRRFLLNSVQEGGIQLEPLRATILMVFHKKINFQVFVKKSLHYLNSSSMGKKISLSIKFPINVVKIVPVVVKQTNLLL